MSKTGNREIKIHQQLVRTCEETTRESAIEVEMVNPDGRTRHFAVAKGDDKELLRLIRTEKQAEDDLLIWSIEKEHRSDNWDRKIPSDILSNIEAHIERVELHRAALAQLDLPQGFSLHSKARSGHIYYRDGERILELYVEMSGVKKYDFLANESGLSHWILPAEQLLTSEERSHVRQLLLKWFDAKGYVTNIK